MDLFNNGNKNSQATYTMVGSATNTTFADNGTLENDDCRPSSYGMQSQAQEVSALLPDIQRKLGIQDDTMVLDDTDVNTDIMPSSSTMDLSFRKNYTVSSNAVAMSTKTKVAIASYVLVALILVAAIAICAVSVGSSYTIIASQEALYTETLTELGALESAVASFTYEELAASAAALGYSVADSSNSVSYTVLETRSAQNYSVSTNWFDSVCDWVSGVFGG